jgi:hypothetical protein
MAQVVEYLPSKCEALNWDSSTGKKKTQIVSVTLTNIAPNKGYYYFLTYHFLAIIYWSIDKYKYYVYVGEALVFPSHSPHFPMSFPIIFKYLLISYWELTENIYIWLYRYSYIKQFGTASVLVEASFVMELIISHFLFSWAFENVLKYMLIYSVSLPYAYD